MSENNTHKPTEIFEIKPSNVESPCVNCRKPTFETIRILALIKNTKFYRLLNTISMCFECAERRL